MSPGLMLMMAGAAAGSAGGGAPAGLWDLFLQSVDLFTALLATGSLVAVAIMYLNAVDIRTARILRPGSIVRLRELAEGGQWDELRRLTEGDDAFPAMVVRAALAARAGGAAAIREAAELAASEQCARWFRRIEPLNVIGNLAPLVGLAGTVWGMILAFTSLGQTGGQAGPADLSLGISKALFHTLFGLCLAIVCLTVFGLYRSVVDRICTRAMVVSAELVELLERDAPGVQP